MTRIAPIFVLCLLAACGGGDSRTAGGVTPDEARALDEAAEMIEARRLPAEALEPGPAPASAPHSATVPSK